MRFGAVLPNQLLPHTAEAVTKYGRAVEGAGLTFIASYDHVLGADTTTRPDWTGSYDHKNEFHESFVFIAFLAAITRLEFVTNVLILPQRQTALVAKQMADLDLLLDGRLRLGAGVGWNPVEYEALDVPFKTRGERLEEQVEVLRLLWTNESVNFEGKFHHIDRAGIAPLPRQRPIPIWLGGANTRRGVPPVRTDRVLGRIGRISDGWIASGGTNEELETNWRTIGDAAEAAGRDRRTLGFQPITDIPTVENADEFFRNVELWRTLGATHVSLRAKQGTASIADHLEALAGVPKYLEMATS